MKRLKNTANLPWICGGLGVAGMLLRHWLLNTGFDEKGLLREDHPAHWLLVLTAAAAVLAVTVALWGSRDSQKSIGMFPASAVGAVSAAVGCLGILRSVWAMFAQPQTTLIRITWAIGIPAVLAAALLAWCRYKGLRPHFALRSVVTMYFMFHLVYHYQQWFSQTQAALFVMQLLAQVLLILALYHRTALEADLGGWKRCVAVSQLAAFFCLAAVPGAEHPLFYGAMAIWLLGDRCVAGPVPGEAEEGV